MASKTDDPVKQLTEEQIAEFKEVRACSLALLLCFNAMIQQNNASLPDDFFIRVVKMTVW